ncbi:MAG: sugar phosphate isomerase/epimerase family protein [Candidatus Methylomirabilota bacterium]
MALRDRIGIDLGRRIRLEEGIEWAAKNGVRHIDIQLDTAANALTTFDDRRAAAVRAAREKHGIHLGLHTLSAVNVAEYSPYVSEAMDEYLRAYVDIAPKLGADWIVVHGGYHFTADRQLRIDTAIDRLKRTVAYAEKKGARLLLENHNKEPETSEIHYVPFTLEEFLYYDKQIQSPNFRLSFTANHAHLVPEGVAGFCDALDFSRVGEVRLADCFRLGHEVHLVPGKGDFDFADMFRRVEAKGFTGHYMNAFGTLDDMLAARDYLVEQAKTVGVA